MYSLNAKISGSKSSGCEKPTQLRHPEGAGASCFLISYSPWYVSPLNRKAAMGSDFLASHSYPFKPS
jgi:hypothetical protein